MELNVLVIDDEETVCDIITSTADLLDVASFSISSPHDLETLDVSGFNVIFLDLMMPGKDGIEVIRELSQLDFKGTLILMSGFDRSVLNSATDLAEEYNLNVHSFLTKPFRIDEIKVIIQNLQTVKVAQASPAFTSKQLSPQEIQSAIEQGAFCIHYQPQVDLSNHRLIGLEALIRLQGEQDEIIFPDRFIDVAEEAHIIHDLTKAVIEKAFSEFKTLLVDYPKLTLSINLSSQDLDRPEFTNWLCDMADEHNISSGKIILEVTETQKILSYSNALFVLSRLRLKGFKVSIDDFGTGHAVLEQIKRLPATELKIDRTFIDDAMHNEKSRVLIRNTINMCQELDLDVVAEGIETPETEALIVQMGGKIGQGYLYSKPLSFSDLTVLLSNQSRIIPSDSLFEPGEGQQASSLEVKLIPNESKSSEIRHSTLASMVVDESEAKSRLSYILPLTGKFAFIGQSQKVGAELAFASRKWQTNRLQIVPNFCDDESDFEQFFQSLKQESLGGSLAVIGPAFPIVQSANFVKLTQKFDLPIIAPFNGCNDLRQSTASSIYNFKPGYMQELLSIIDVLKGRQGKTVFFMSPGRFTDGITPALNYLSDADVVYFDPNDPKVAMSALQQKKPDHVVFLGTAKLLAELVDELHDEHIQYYTTSLVGAGMVRKLFSRKAKLKLELTEPLPDFQGDSAAAQLFRDVAANPQAEIEKRHVNAISFEAFLVTNLILDLCEGHSDEMDRSTLKTLLEGLFSYDLGLDKPVGWSADNRQLLHHVYHIKI